MLRTLRSSRRRNHRYTLHICFITTALLLLLSVSLLHLRLSRPSTTTTTTTTTTTSSLDDPFEDPLLQDSSDDLRSSSSSDDRIDELDDADASKLSDDDDEILRGLDDDDSSSSSSSNQQRGNGYYFDHVSGAVRRAFDRRSIDEIDRWDYYASVVSFGFSEEDRSKVAFGSDDVPVDEELRRKVVQVRGIEDALMLKLGSDVSPLREGWGPWFDAKSDFLRKDKMFKSNLEILNPLSNLLLQDPDGVGVTGLTRGDKLVQKGLLHKAKEVPFLGKKPLGLGDKDFGAEEGGFDHSAKMHHSANQSSLSSETGNKISEHRRRLDDNADVSNNNLRTVTSGSEYVKGGNDDDSVRSNADSFADSKKAANSISEGKSESSDLMYAGRGRWGYFPGLNPHLSFLNFMDTFFRQFKCSMRVFMVWNSPPWMYTIRHQRGLESLLHHHPEACVVVFSETIELDFFKEFQKDGYKVAVAMPNLEELLKDTPTSIFASVWHEWRTTKFYSTHYSELVRLAALYKYGGLYLDCDIIVLKPLSSFSNSVGMEEQSPKSPLNGAVMAFRKNSFFIMDCLLEFYSTYDDNLLRWNGADLLTRVAGNFSSKENANDSQQELKVQPANNFFPVGSHDIKRYFTAAAEDAEKVNRDALLGKILNESYTFHFWNSLTSTLVPEPDSLVARIINHHCIRCFDVL